MFKFLKYSPVLTALIGSSLPLLAQAQNTVDRTIARLKETANLIIGLLFIIATLVFLWGVVQFIASAGDEAAKKKAKALMTWGILGLALMAAAWGVTQILIEYFNIGGSPTFKPIPIAP